MDIRLQWGDLSALSASVDAVREGLDGLDISAAMEGAEVAMPGSVSAGRVGAAAAEINRYRTALSGLYGTVARRISKPSALPREHRRTAAGQHQRHAEGHA